MVLGLFGALFAPIDARGAQTSETLTVCGVQSYLGMPTTDFLSALRHAAQCKIPTTEDRHNALVSVNDRTNRLTVQGDVRFREGKIAVVTKRYPEPANDVELAEWVIDLLSKFENEHRDACIITTDAINQPDLHTRTTNVQCGTRTLSITAGSGSFQDAADRTVRSTYSYIEETLGP